MSSEMRSVDQGITNYFFPWVETPLPQQGESLTRLFSEFEISNSDSTDEGKRASPPAKKKAVQVLAGKEEREGQTIDEPMILSLIPPQPLNPYDALFQTSKAEARSLVEGALSRLDSVLFVLSSCSNKMLIDCMRAKISDLRGSASLVSTINYEELNQSIVSLRNQLAEILKDLDVSLLKIVKDDFFEAYICPRMKERSLVFQEIRNALRLAQVKNQFCLGTPRKLPQAIRVMTDLGLFDEAISLEENISEQGIDKDVALEAIAVGLARAGYFERAKSFVQKISGVMKEFVLETIAERFSQAGLFDQALDVALHWDNEADGSSKRIDRALLPIAQELARNGRFDEAFALAQGMADLSESKSYAYAAILIELTKTGRWREASSYLIQIPESVSVSPQLRVQISEPIVRKLVQEHQFDEALGFIQATFASRGNQGDNITHEFELLSLVVEGLIKARQIKKVQDIIESFGSHACLNKALSWIVEKFVEVELIDDALAAAYKISEEAYDEKETAFSLIVKKLVQLGLIKEAIAIAATRPVTVALKQVVVEMARKNLFSEALSLVEEKILFVSDKLFAKGWIAIEMARDKRFDEAIRLAHMILEHMKSIHSWQLEEDAFLSSDWLHTPVTAPMQGDVTRWPVKDLLGRVVEEMIKLCCYDVAYSTLKGVSEKECKSKVDLLNTIATKLIQMGRHNDAYVVAEEISEASEKEQIYMAIVVGLTKAGCFEEAHALYEKIQLRCAI